MEKAIDDVYNDFFSLTQTLRLLSEDGDSMATGLLQQVGNIKFLSAVYLLHQVLPLLAHLSKVFQAGSVSFAAIGPAINYTLEALETVSKEKRPLSALQKDLCTDGRLSVCDLSSPLAHQEQNLSSLTDRYVKALKKNIKTDLARAIAMPTNNMMTKSPTEWLVERMLSMRSTYQHFFPGMLCVAEVCLSLPASNT